MRLKDITLKLISLLFIFSILSPFSISAQQEQYQDQQDNESIGKISALSAVPLETGHSEIGLSKSHENVNKIEETQVWNATNYIAGDIVSSTYQVQLGDTLWEISEAYLEDGIYWTLILNKNVDQIGFLPDGSQALIYPGQILNL